MSPILDKLCDGPAPDCPFQVNGMTYNYVYYLVGVIYVKLDVFVKSLTCPANEKHIKYNRAQERA